MKEKICIGGKWFNTSVEHNDRIFRLGLITSDFIFYMDFNEYDDNGNTLMYRANTMEVVSNNYFANVGLHEELEEVYDKKKIALYMDNEIKENLNDIMKYWKDEE